jgi:hypothetical protein
MGAMADEQVSFWIADSFNLNTFVIASSMISAGLTWWQVCEELNHERRQPNHLGIPMCRHRILARWTYFSAQCPTWSCFRTHLPLRQQNYIWYLWISMARV